MCERVNRYDCDFKNILTAPEVYAILKSRKLFPAVIEIRRRWPAGKEALRHKFIARLGEGKQ